MFVVTFGSGEFVLFARAHKCNAAIFLERALKFVSVAGVNREHNTNGYWMPDQQHQYVLYSILVCWCIAAFVVGIWGNKSSLLYQFGWE